jgi:hypothetical protein
MFYGNEDHGISFNDASALTKNYRQANPVDLKGGFFGKDAIMELLNQNGCVGIRYYYGKTSSGEKVLVLVGTDTNENDLVGATDVCKEAAIPCPPRCGNANLLNS